MGGVFKALSFYRRVCFLWVRLYEDYTCVFCSCFLLCLVVMRRKSITALYLILPLQWNIYLQKKVSIYFVYDLKDNSDV